VGAFSTALLGLWVVHFLERRLRVPSDAALCVVLSTFFGIGITIASEVQFSYSALYKQVLAYLYGQAATMTDIHIIIYGILAAMIIGMVLLLYKELQVMIFDRSYAKSLGIPVSYIDTCLFILITLAVVIGIRSVGVVLMSAMLIAPAVAARQFTNKLSYMFPLAAVFGVISGLLGNYFSVNMTIYFAEAYPSARIILPTGPMIVLVASFICFLALLFAPERGLIIRLIRIIHFRYQCLYENILKAIWRLSPQAPISFKTIQSYHTTNHFFLRFILWRMIKSGWLQKVDTGTYQLTSDGKSRAAKIVRLHRLWEVYLVSYLGAGVERVHRNAEEMEHIITPELESELILLLNDPKQDPHHQPIPSREDINV